MTAFLERIPTVTADSAAAHFTDEHLMEMIQTHMHSGLDLLHARYATLLKTLSMRMLHNNADAEDLLQDVFLEIWDRAPTYDPLKGRALSWIVTLTRRRSIDRLRRRVAYCRMEAGVAEEAKAHDDGWTHVHEDLAQRERNGHLQRALACLPEAQQNAITLAYHEQMTQREIAAKTGIPLGTIKTRLELGLKKMAVSLYGFKDALWGNNHAAGT
jgi:RNA polymerase sigma-70 factor (ECF subfamily)